METTIKKELRDVGWRTAIFIGMVDLLSIIMIAFLAPLFEVMFYNLIGKFGTVLLYLFVIKLIQYTVIYVLIVSYNKKAEIFNQKLPFIE